MRHRTDAVHLRQPIKVGLKRSRRCKLRRVIALDVKRDHARQTAADDRLANGVARQTGLRRQQRAVFGDARQHGADGQGASRHNAKVGRRVTATNLGERIDERVVPLHSFCAQPRKKVSILDVVRRHYLRDLKTEKKVS